MNSEQFFNRYKKELIQLTISHRQQNKEGLGAIIVDFNSGTEDNANVYYLAISNPAINPEIKEDIINRSKQDNRNSLIYIYFLEQNTIKVIDLDLESDKHNFTLFKEVKLL